MERQIHKIRYVVSGVLMLAIALAPFVVFKFADALRTEEGREWPSLVSITSAERDSLRSVAVLRMLPTPVLVKIPLDASLDVPNAGRLRASTAYHISGAASMPSALTSTIGLPVGYYAHFDAVTDALKSTDLGPRTSEVAAALNQAQTVSAPGKIIEGTYFNTIQMDLVTVRAILRGGALPASTSTPTPTIITTPTASARPGLDPARITIQVLNQGAATGAATRMTQDLQDKGFTLARVGDTPSETVTGSFIYFTRDEGMALFVKTRMELDGFTVDSLPSSYRQSADVVIVLGRTGSASTSRPRPRSTPASSPTPQETTTVG